jgi:hypothetical protein
VNDSRLIVIMSNAEKKDLVKLFDEKTTEYFQKKVNGSLRLHFSAGYLAKIESTQFD